MKRTVPQWQEAGWVVRSVGDVGSTMVKMEGSRGLGDWAMVGRIWLEREEEELRWEGEVEVLEKLRIEVEI